MRRLILCLPALLLCACAGADGFEPITSCESVGNAHPVCGFASPEDLVPLPGNQALLVSEFGAMESQGSGGGLALLVLESEERRVLFRGGDATGAPTPGWGDASCPGPPPRSFSPHGIDLAPRPDGKLALAVVQHGGRESIELFEVTGSGTDWSVAWRGCLMPPEDAWLNETILLSDGSVLASHMMPRGDDTSAAPSDPSGHILRWTPGRGFSKLPGTDTRLANGFEVSVDERTLYLNSSMGDGVRRIDLATGELTGSAEVQTCDNTTWAPDGKLLVASLEPLENDLFERCSGLTDGACPIDFQIVAVDPDTMETSVRFDSKGTPMGGGTVGLQVGDELFIGSFAGNRILRVDLGAAR